MVVTSCCGAYLSAYMVEAHKKKRCTAWDMTYTNVDHFDPALL